MKKVKIAKSKNTRPKKIGKGTEVVKAHNKAKLSRVKGKKPVNSKSNYGVN